MSGLDDLQALDTICPKLSLPIVTHSLDTHLRQRAEKSRNTPSSCNCCVARAGEGGEKISLRKQPTFPDATTGFHEKWSLRNDRRNSILMALSTQIWLEGRYIREEGEEMARKIREEGEIGAKM